MEKNNQFSLLEMINLGLILLNLVLIFYICYLSYVKEDPRQTLLATAFGVSSLQGGTQDSAQSMQQYPPFSIYKEGLLQKDIFKGFQSEKRQEKVVRRKIIQPVEVDTTVEEIKRYYQVLGILLDENPKALIKDWRNNETLILSIGEKIEKAVLKEIFEDKIILEYKDERIELVP